MIKLSELLSGLDYSSNKEFRDGFVTGDGLVTGDCFVTGVFYDSRKVIPGSVFVAIKGFITDGHNYIDAAVKAGAMAVVVMDACDRDDVLCIRVKDTRIALAHISAGYFSNPVEKIDIIGITGTKGKTTTAYMIEKIFNAAHIPTGLIGTIETKIGDNVFQSPRTTPESYDLQKILKEMADKEIRSCAMEVSSQGLKYNRVYGLKFETGIFTNLYHDHISPAEHENMEDYFQSKLKLFDMCRNAIVNIDDPASPGVMEYIKRNENISVFTVGIKGEGDIQGKNIRIVKEDNKMGISFDLISPWYEGNVFVGMPGVFNIYNALFAIGAAGIKGIAFDAILGGLSDVHIKGRCQQVNAGQDFHVIVDYAHNAMSLENLLLSMREYTQGRIISVFGCGGDRDRSRRFEMGEVSGKYADYTIITSDNPRTEDPEAIMADVEKGIKKTKGEYTKITDRTAAIYEGIDLAGKGDMVIIAGKGHETYQEFHWGRIHFDDYEKAFDALKVRGSGKSINEKD